MAKLGKSSQRAAQQNQGKKGGGGGGGDADKNLKQMLEFARKKDIDRRQNSGNPNEGNDEEDNHGGSGISYIERIPGIISAICKVIFRVPWADIMLGQVMNVMSAFEESMDIIKTACAKFNTEGWSPFQNLLKALGMKVIDYVANFFERHVPRLYQDDPNAYENDPHKYDNEDLHQQNKHGGNFSDEDNDEFWRGLRRTGDYGSHEQPSPYDEYGHHDPYHSNTRSDGGRHQDYGPQQESQESRGKRSFPAIAGMGRSSIFGRH